MAIFGDVNDNRVIPLLLLSGIIFMTGMYLIYFYRWISSIFCGSQSISKIHIQQELEIPFNSSFIDQSIHTTQPHTQPQWELESTIVVFQQSIRPSSGSSPINIHHSHIPHSIQHNNNNSFSSLKVPSPGTAISSSPGSVVTSLSPISSSMDGKDCIKY